MPKQNTEQVIPMVDTVSKEIYDFSKAEDAEANRLFYEATGQTPPGEEGEEKNNEADNKEEPAKKEEPVKDEEPAKKEEPAKEEPVKAEEDLTKDLTVENADKRISAAQRKMHDSNKSAKDAIDTQNKLREENEQLRALIDKKVVDAPAGDPVTKEPAADEGNQTEDEISTDLENLRKEYPEIAEPMIKMMQKQNAQNVALQERLDKQDAKDAKREEAAKVTKENTHINSIAEAHPDYEEISSEPLMDEWIDGLEPIAKAGAEAIRSNGKTKDVIALLTQFKKANGYKLPGEIGAQKAKSTDSKLEKAKKHQTPQFNKSKELNTDDKPILFTQAQMHAWTEAEWAENEAAVNEAMRNKQVR